LGSYKNHYIRIPHLSLKDDSRPDRPREDRTPIRSRVKSPKERSKASKTPQADKSA